ncbi:MAG: hypothetical protein IKU15_00295 [Clostridia bacterium]|nr:hypothetical protein [Clostridia bacterium]
MLKDLIEFDCEVFPEWWCFVWNRYNGTDDFEQYVIRSDEADYMTKLEEMAYAGYLCGFNIKAYDMQILHFALSGWDPEELYEHSMSIINSTDGKWRSLAFWGKYEFTDLFDDIKGMGSLKQFESNIGLSIHESTIPFGKSNLTEEEKLEIIEYCKFDVKATNKLTTARWGYLNAKAMCSRLSKLSEAECLKNTSAKVCAKMLGAKKTENPNMPIYDIPEKLKPVFEETLHPAILDKFIGQELANDFAYEVTYMKNHFVFGAGGVHSTYKDTLYCISDDDYVLVNADFENLYPSLLVNFDYYATGIPQEGRELFKYMLSECRRLKAELRTLKNQGKTETEEYKELFGIRDAIKLILNASTGAMRQQFSPLFDPQNIIALCMTGQLLTTCMAKLAFNKGALLIQSNTDGILLKIKRNVLAETIELLNEFSEKVNIPLEIEEEFAVFQKDVNNYVLLSAPEAKPKLKGRWAKKSGSDVPLTPLFAPVINNAVVNYYSKNIPIADTVRNCTNPLDFMMTTMKGPTYSLVTYQSNIGEVTAMNINRCYATNNKSFGTLYKIKTDEDTGEIIRRDKTASIPEHCRLWNDAVTIDSKLTEIDYDWYIAQAKDKLKTMEKV